MLAASALSSDDRQRERVALNPACSPQTLQRLAGDDNHQVRCNAYANPAASQQMLEGVAAGSSLGDCQAVASSPSSSTELLEKLLSLHDSDQIATYLARNPNCPPRRLPQWGMSTSWETRAAVARNPATSTATLEWLLDGPDVISGDEDGWEDGMHGCDVASNPTCPSELLRRIVVNEYDIDAIRVAARHPNCSTSLLESLVEDSDTRVKQTAAAHPACTAEMIGRLVASPDVDHRRGVAANPACPPGLLKRLSIDEDPTVIEVLSTNPATPAELIRQLPEAALSSSLARRSLKTRGLL